MNKDKGMMRLFYKASVTFIFGFGTFVINGSNIYAETNDQLNPPDITGTTSDNLTEKTIDVNLEMTENPSIEPVKETELVNIQGNLNPSASIEGETKMKLTWNHIEGVSAYQIIRNQTEIYSLQSINEEVLSYTDETVIPNHRYEYQIIGLNEQGFELVSESFIVESMDTIPPEAPTGFESLEVTMPNQIDLRWNKVDDAAGYFVYRDDVQLFNVPNSDISFSDLSAEPNLTYHYSIKAYDKAGNISESSDISVLSLDTLPPSIPTIVEGIAVAANQVHLLWTPSTDNREMSHYNIYLKRTNADFEYIDKSNINKFIHEGLGNDTHYQFKITAVDLNGNESQFSEIYDVVTYSDPTSVVYETLPFAINREDVPLIEIFNKKMTDLEEVKIQTESEANQQSLEFSPMKSFYDDTSNNTSQILINPDLIARLERNLEIKK